MCETLELLHPYQSTRDLDGVRGDRETVQDIAYDGETFERRPRKRQQPTRPIITREGA